MSNNVNLTGTVFEPKSGSTENGKSILTFNLSFYQGKTVDGKTDYGSIRVTAFGPLASNAADLQERDKVIVSGRPRGRKWTDKSGNKRYSHELIADEIGNAYSTFGNDDAGGGEEIPF